jgi:lysozyme
MTMTISPEGKNFIKQWESLELTAYLDGGGVPTIGWGHTKNVALGQTITEAQAEQFLSDDLAPTELTLNTNITVPVNQNQFDATCSLAFNIGNSAFSGSTLLKKLNAGDTQGAADEFPRWCYDNGKVIQGLVNRRNAERTLFLS